MNPRGKKIPGRASINLGSGLAWCYALRNGQERSSQKVESCTQAARMCMLWGDRCCHKFLGILEIAGRDSAEIVRAVQQDGWN